ncbi:circadian clock protein KaiC [Mucilaginibacter phyllosphaerae]|uniref:non-specific serine/threonine protein kinase n=1 Tax=Mucilaginibacter phyllosphaerae TaxID=1812349 RepID=A0A4Y8AKA6_9SPHI|nr:circadian clock protein KaiC [Mucilaginibacter phyllosphaerae]MBB3967886.1 circadian clock protein KaiC [Mucilaginibacter phyllosphaerae]TEW69072.1 circadian clock protein KaiC [Mucilaginibacter phyllosphaerae]GGH02663.1 circadian clock protein KaiC [Mucilaginibacter phyllosphaerae]
MSKSQKKIGPKSYSTLAKVLTGITGLDEITEGGLPKGRPTLICGEAGSGKTLMSIEFIVRGAIQYNEPGVFVAFEEKSDELAMNVASLGFDLKKLQDEKKLRIDHIHIDRSEIEETGEYDLEGLFIRLGYAIDSIGAKRVVLDTLENLFSGLDNLAVLRTELRRLFSWLKEKGVTAIITGERGDGSLTRQGLEEYVSDCVILLDNRVVNQITTRRLRVVKYRGTVHGTNEYPFLIDQDGISVLPVTSLKMANKVSNKRISTGVKALDGMLGGQGLFQGGSVLVSGTAGTGKTSLAASFANEACNRKEMCVYFAMEESPSQIIRNMSSIGINLQKHVDSGLLYFNASRPNLYGLEMHLVAMHKCIKKYKPSVVIVDPITNFINIGSVSEVKNMLVRMIDFLQEEQISVMFTALSLNTIVSEQTDEGVSSLVDAWILVRDIEFNGERNRGLYVMKSRGMKHSNQVREFVITDNGLNLIDVYLGPDGILTGSAREQQLLLEKTGEAIRSSAFVRKDREILRKRQVLEAKIASLNSEFESVEEELNKVYLEEELKKQILEKNRAEVTRMRRGETKEAPKTSRKK